MEVVKKRGTAGRRGAGSPKRNKTLIIPKLKGGGKKNDEARGMEETKTRRERKIPSHRKRKLGCESVFISLSRTNRR